MDVTDNDTAGVQQAQTLVEDGGVYLLVVDDSPEFHVALKAASVFANNNKALIALLYVMDAPGFQQWSGVEEQIIAEQKRDAQEHLDKAASILKDMHGHEPYFYTKEGDVEQAVVDVLEENSDVKALILGAGHNSSNPLISHFTGKALSHLRVPLFIIPDQ